MTVKEQNAYLIMYVLLDYIRFLKDMEVHTDDMDEKQQLHQQCDFMRVYSNRYLERMLNEKEIRIFTQELNALFL